MGDWSMSTVLEQTAQGNSAIGAVENGSYNPTLKLCVAICKATDKTLNDLFWEEEENEEQYVPDFENKKGLK